LDREFVDGFAGAEEGSFVCDWEVMEDEFIYV
jgi:hypothetical protein